VTQSESNICIKGGLKKNGRGQHQILRPEVVLNYCTRVKTGNKLELFVQPWPGGKKDRTTLALKKRKKKKM